MVVVNHKLKRIAGRLMLWVYIKGTKEWMWVPSEVGHKFRPIWVKPVERLEEHKTHTRLKVFYNRGIECVKNNCHKKGKWIMMTRDVSRGLHLDLYTEDFELMTVDHIIPKSKGGTNHLANKQPMCTKCNSNKSNKLPEKHVIDAVLAEIQTQNQSTNKQKQIL